MSKFFKTILLSAAIGLVAGSQAFAGEAGSETRTIDARVVKVTLDGIVALDIKQGAIASLTIFADKDLLSKVTTSQSGDTLRIGTTLHGRFGSGKESNQIRAELVLPALAELNSTGVGRSEISGFGGDSLVLKLCGAGPVNLVSKYKKVNANLSGVGKLNIETRDADMVELSLPGAGQVEATGQTKGLRVVLSGVGSLNAKDLTSGWAHLVLSGLGNATINAKQEANVTLSGLGSITVYGEPQERHASTSGMGRVTWK